MMVRVIRQNERLPWRVIDLDTGRTLGASDTRTGAERIAFSFARMDYARTGARR